MPVALHQGQHRLAPRGLLLQGAGAVFGQLMQLAEGDGQGRVVDHAVLEAGHAVAAQFQFVQYTGDPLVLGVEAAIAPARLMGGGAGMQLVGVDQHHAADRRQVLAAAVPEALGAGFDHREHVAFVHMRGEALLEVTRVQHLDVAQGRRLPEVCLLRAGAWSCQPAAQKEEDQHAHQHAQQHAAGQQHQGDGHQ